MIKDLQYSKNSLLMFLFTVILSFLVFSNSLLNKPHMLSWISLLVSLIFFLFSYILWSSKKIFLFLLYLFHYLFIVSCFVEDRHLIISNLVNNPIVFFILPIMCFLMILPSIFINRFDFHSSLNYEACKTLVYFLLPFILFSIVYLTPYTFATFVYGANNIRSGGIQNSEYASIMPENFLTTLSVGVSILYPLYIFLLSYFIALQKSKKLIFVCFLGLLCGIIGGMVFATRDRFVYILFYGILFYWLWKPYINKDNKIFMSLKKYIYIFSSTILALFLWITIDRFTTDFDKLFSWTLFYYGAQPYIFADVIDKNLENFGLAYLFPIFFESKNFEAKESYFWLWGTLFQNIYISGGWFLCFFVILFNLIFSSWFFSSLKKYVWIYAIYLILYFQIISQGVFYFNLGFSGGNYYLMLMILIGCIMQFLISRRRF